MRPNTAVSLAVVLAFACIGAILAKANNWVVASLAGLFAFAWFSALSVMDRAAKGEFGESE